MKFSTKTHGHPAVEADEDGHLYSPQTREVMAARVPAAALPALEASAALGLAARQLHQRMERWCEREGLSETRLGILFMLRHMGEGLPLGGLAARLRVSARNVTGVIDNLERDGLVARVPDPADRRSVLARLTDAGRARIDGLWDGNIRWQQTLLAGFTAEEMVQLRHLCLKLVTNMEAASLQNES